MKRIKLKDLLNMTEQAPQPPQGSPVPAQSAPSSIETPEPAPEAPTGGAEAPIPDNPSEYDFTKDFRAFEDAKNKAEAAAKKKLLDRMNKILIGKKIVANASRGYGQPKTDYTIEKVKKISVEFWYKDYVVIVSDENDKKFFLTPGINIKIEGAGEEPAAAGAPPATQAPNEPPKEEPVPEAPPQGGEPEATPPAGENPAAEPQNEPGPEPEQPAAPEPQAATPEPKAPEAPSTAPVPPKPKAKPQPQAAPQQPVQEPEEDPNLRKKKQPVAEDDFGGEDDDSGAYTDVETPSTSKGEEYKVAWVQDDVGLILSEYVRQDLVNPRSGVLNVIPFIKGKPKWEGGEESSTVTYVLDIPEDAFQQPFDPKDLQLAIRNELRSYGGPGEQFTRGGCDIQKVGRFYRLEIYKTVGWDI